MCYYKYTLLKRHIERVVVLENIDRLREIIGLVHKANKKAQIYVDTERKINDDFRRRVLEREVV